ncbi:nucleolar protein 14 [Xylaria cf. heliscus]|nr:nucleolar protein 14 [Xylaria cf. heliscus]
MPGSQLKRLKASLREQGVIGPQQSKKQRRKVAQNGKVNTNKRAAALESIREEFNPFDFKHNARGSKFQVTSNRPVLGDAAKGIAGRPGDAKAMGEERRRQTLLVEMSRRNKTGGIRDQRFGENDASMTYEEKMAQRFVREKQSHKTSMFDLEDDEPTDGLTHMGKSLSFPERDDFEEADLLDPEGTDSGDDLSGNQRGIKRLRDLDETEDQIEENTEGEPEKKKTKQEIYKEIIAKSKMHKAERQAQKDADEDLREELDEELSDIQALLFTKPKPQSSEGDEATPKPDESGKGRMERDYDLRLRQLAMDRRAKPSDRTLTEEEIAQRDVEKLKDLEDKRQRRMRGEEMSDSEDGNEQDAPDIQTAADKPGWFDEDVEEDFKLGTGIRTRPTATELGFDDEDDFIVEDDLLASGSDLEPIESEDEDSSAENEEEDDQDDEFTKGLLNEAEAKDSAFSKESGMTKKAASEISSCPETLEQLLDISRNLSSEQIPPLIQKVRILYHPKLASENKTKLASFSRVLVQYLFHLSNTPSPPPFATLESIIRHIHSLAKSFPIEISEEFRSRVNDLTSRCLSPIPGDLVVLVAIGTIFPPSDAFHPVITPAMLQIARYLGQKIPKSTTDFVQGVFMGSLALHYLKLSQRFCPEFMNFCLNTLTSLAPTKPTKKLGNFPQHEPVSGMRIIDATKIEIRRLKITDCIALPSSEKDLSTRISALDTTLQLLDTASQLYAGKPSFIESFEPVVLALGHLTKASSKSQLPTALIDHAVKLQKKLHTILTMSKLARRSLELHHHRPLAIKIAIPKFEDQFDPDRHYDADKDRAELAKLKAEHKKERKGAMRELRKDANFMAREKLRIKKQKDAAYEKKYKRLVAEIQGEEGREANAYDREKQARKRAAKRG